jgi:ABC-2 type transport system permease protein
MKILFQIAKNEWRYLFYSPIAWFVLLVFMVQCAFLYSDPLYYYANWQDIMRKNSPSFHGFDFSLTAALFTGSNVFANVLHNLCFFIPVLTMGLISREAHSGSSKLLYSAPVNIRQIVMGKYIGIMLYNLLLVGILLFFMITAFFNIKEVDYGLLLSAALGFYLLTCTYSAIGLFMSALTSYQVIAALSTFVIIFVLGLIGGLWQRYDIVRDCTYFLSLQNRTLKMLNGLIVSRDVIYFIVVALMFVGFTIVRLKAGREGKPWYVRTARYLAVLAVTLLIGYTSSRPVLTLYLDATAQKTNTIPKRMQDLITAMGDSTLEVTLYGNLLQYSFAHALPEVRNASYMAKMWEPYLRFKPDIRFKYVYYYDTKDSVFLHSPSGQTLRQIAEDKAKAFDFDMALFKSPEQIRKIVDLYPEDYPLIMQLTYRGRTQFLRTYPTYQDPWPNLLNVAAAFKRLLQPEKIPTIYFATGELERNIFKATEREYALHTFYKKERNALINIGFDVDTLNLTVQDIPGNCTALILADPKMNMSTVAQSKLSNYVRQGGNMLILGEPGKQPVLNPVLDQLGVQFMNGQLVQPSYHETPDKVTPYYTAANSSLAETLTGIQQSLKRGDTARMLLPGVMSMAYTPESNFTIKPLLLTRPGRTWLKAGNLVIDSTLPPMNPAEGDLLENSFTTAVQLTRPINNKEQRIIICGDADFASNMRLKPNYNYLIALYSWITYNEFPVYMFSPRPKDVLLNTSERGAHVQKILYVWVLPGLILLSAMILLIRRKRQ